MFFGLPADVLAGVEGMPPRQPSLHEDQGAVEFLGDADDGEMTGQVALRNIQHLPGCSCRSLLEEADRSEERRRGSPDRPSP